MNPDREKIFEACKNGTLNQIPKELLTQDLSGI
jgi:hypothetical protein